MNILDFFNKNKKILISFFFVIFFILIIFFGPLVIAKSFIGLDITQFNEGYLPPINGYCYFDQYSFQNWANSNMDSNFNIRIKYEFFNLQDVKSNFNCWGKIKGTNYEQGESLSNIGSYVTLNVLRVNYNHQIIAAILSLYLLYFFNRDILKNFKLKNGDRILILLLFNTSLILFLRFYLEDGVTKTFLKNLSTSFILLFLILLPLISNNLKNNYQHLYIFKNKIFYANLISIVPTIYLFLTGDEGIFLGKVIYLISAYLLTFQVFVFLLLRKELFKYFNNKEYHVSEFFNFKNFLNSKILILVLMTLIPIIRFSIANSQILGINEIFAMIGIFFVLSYFLIAIISNLLSKLFRTNNFLIVSTAMTLVVYELPTISTNFNLRYINWFPYVFLVFVFLIIFLNVIINSKTKQLILIFILFLGVGINNQVIAQINKAPNADLESLQQESPFNSILKNFENKYSIVVLTYDGYPQNETLDLYGIDNSSQIDYLVSNGFFVHNGTYSIGSYTLGTMSRFFEGTSYKFDADNSRYITGGHSSFVKILSENGYTTAGVFPSSFYFPPNDRPFYDFYFPNKAQRSLKMTKSILRGNLSHKDAIYTIPYDNYLEEKNKILSKIGNSTNPNFLYTHTYFPGHTQNSGSCESGEFENWKEELKYANSEMRNDISLLKGNLENTIIIIMGDHGPFLTKNCTGLAEYDSSEIDKLDIQDRHGTFLAIRYPKEIQNENINHLMLLQNTLIQIASVISGDPNAFNKYALPQNLNIDTTHLPEDINVFNNTISGGVDNQSKLFIDTSLLGK